MGLKIKWNDDRVRGATTAILLLVRDRLSRGQGGAGLLVAEALADYRADPDGYKARKASWADVRQLGPLTSPTQVASYQNLLSAVDRVTDRLANTKRQFNSLLELDNALIAYLNDVR